MKHVIILGDGMADWAVPSLGDKTLLQYAHTPYMDKLASMGRTGVLKTVAAAWAWLRGRTAPGGRRLPSWK